MHARSECTSWGPGAWGQGGAPQLAGMPTVDFGIESPRNQARPDNATPGETALLKLLSEARSHSSDADELARLRGVAARVSAESEKISGHTPPAAASAATPPSSAPFSQLLKECPEFKNLQRQVETLGGDVGNVRQEVTSFRPEVQHNQNTLMATLSPLRAELCGGGARPPTTGGVKSETATGAGMAPPVPAAQATLPPTPLTLTRFLENGEPAPADTSLTPQGRPAYVINFVDPDSQHGGKTGKMITDDLWPESATWLAILEVSADMHAYLCKFINANFSQVKLAETNNKLMTGERIGWNDYWLELRQVRTKQRWRDHLVSLGFPKSLATPLDDWDHIGACWLAWGMRIGWLHVPSQDAAQAHVRIVRPSCPPSTFGTAPEWFYN